MKPTRCVQFLLTASVFLSSAVSAQCPQGCYCNNKFVDCSALMDFPTSLPEDTERFRVSQMNIEEIPANAFLYLVNITQIELKNCNIGTIARCAFTDLSSIKRIIFDKTVVGTIESFAFRDLKDLEHIEIAESRIGRLKPFAFYKLHKVSIFSIVQTNLPVFYTHAIYDVSEVNMMIFNANNISDIATGALMYVTNVTSIQLTHNVFWNMHCGVLDYLFDTDNALIFSNNSFYCNCSIAPLVNTAGRIKYVNFLPTSRCVGPDSVKGKSLWELTFAEIGCSSLGPGSNIPCNSAMLTPNPDCSYIPTPEPEGEPENGGTSLARLSGSFTTVALSLVGIITVLCL